MQVDTGRVKLAMEKYQRNGGGKKQWMQRTKSQQHENKIILTRCITVDFDFASYRRHPF